MLSAWHVTLIAFGFCPLSPNATMAMQTNESPPPAGSSLILATTIHFKSVTSAIAPSTGILLWFHRTKLEVLVFEGRGF